MTVKRRVTKLEKQSQGPGGVEFVGMGRWDWTEEQLDQAAAEAQERVGPNGTVIRVLYVDDWRGARDEKGFPLVPARGGLEGGQ